MNQQYLGLNKHKINKETTMSIFDQIVHAVKDVAEVAIETAVPILPHNRYIRNQDP